MKFTFPPESKPLDGYTIKRAIHRGGFGEVYYALSDGGKEVALKLLQHNMDIELRGVSQCLNLKHPNLVNIFDIRTDRDGDHWIVMEYVSGKSLDEEMSEHRGPMPVDDVLHWLEGMAAGLAFLHDRGIVHRDLKPANIYREHTVVKIGDVGLAKYISESRRSAQTESVGTVYYMAPEVARGRYGREVDIYSLGIMLYELLTGDVPFDGESTAEILMKHLSEAPDLSPLPVALRPVLANALAKDPMRRTPSAAQLLSEFRQAMAGVQVASEIPEESFIGETAADSSVAIREQAARYDEFVLRLPKGTGKKLRRAADKARKQFRKVAHHAGIEARNAAKQARRDARAALKFAQRVRSRGRRAAVNGNAVHGEHRHIHPPQAARWRERHRRGSVWPWVVIVIVCIGGLLSASDRPRNARVNFFGSTAIVAMWVALGYSIYRVAKSGIVSTEIAGNYGQRIPVTTAPAANEPEPVAASVVVNVDRGRPANPAPLQPVRAANIHRHFPPSTPRAISMRARMTDLTGSMTMAAVLSLIATVGLLLIAAPFFDSVPLAGLFGLTTLLGSWSLLVTSKFFEGRTVDSGARRLMQLGTGVVVGMAAWWIQTQLLAIIPTSRDMVEAVFYDVGPYRLTSDMSRYQPTMAAYMVFFGALFGLRRWWWLCDSFRKKKLRITSLLFSAGLALGVSFIWAFPKDWAMLWAASMTAVVQLASGWVRPEDRPRLVEGASDARVA